LAGLSLDTPFGEARSHITRPEGAPRAALVLGHGAGGGVEAPDLVAAKDAALSEGLAVALIEQPYRVAGKKSQPAASTIDGAWTSICEQLAEGELEGLPQVTGGRSAGARVACRTAAETGAVAVLCLAFPLQPPARKGGKRSPDRLDELEAVEVPILVVQGERDRFGMPPAARNRRVVEVAGDHGLKKDAEAIERAVGEWLATALG
jgi:predicted alpha/beta-hydrolase family hydrolase